MIISRDFPSRNNNFNLEKTTNLGYLSIGKNIWKVLLVSIPMYYTLYYGGILCEKQLKSVWLYSFLLYL